MNICSAWHTHPPFFCPSFSVLEISIQKNPHFNNADFLETSLWQSRSLLPRHLCPVGFHVVLILVDQLRDGHQLIPLILQACNHCIQRVRRVFRPVVHENDRPVIQLVGLHHALDDIVYAIVLPVQRIDRPLDRIVTALLRICYDMIVIISVGRPEQEHLITCQFLHLGMYFHQLLLTLFVGKLGHVFMVLAVVAQIMTVRQDRPHILGVGFHPHKWAYLKTLFCYFYHNLQTGNPHSLGSLNTHPIFFHIP